MRTLTKRWHVVRGAVNERRRSTTTAERSGGFRSQFPNYVVLTTQSDLQHAKIPLHAASRAVRGWFCGISHLFQKAVSCASGDSRPFIAKPCLYRRTAPFPQNRIFQQAARFRRAVPFSQTVPFPQTHTFPRAAPFREKESSSLIAGMPFFLPPSLTPGGGGDIINYSSGANRLFGGML